MESDRGNSSYNGPSGNSGPPTSIDGTRLTVHWWDLV